MNNEKKLKIKFYIGLFCVCMILVFIALFKLEYIEGGLGTFLILIFGITGMFLIQPYIKYLDEYNKRNKF